MKLRYSLIRGIIYHRKGFVQAFPWRPLPNVGLLFSRQDFVQKFHCRIEIFGIWIVGVEVGHLVAALLVGRNMIFGNVDSAGIARVARYGHHFLK